MPLKQQVNYNWHGACDWRRSRRNRHRHQPRQIEREFKSVSTTADAPLFNRPDTMLGICEGIGREFGFHPNLLRVALAVPLVWNPLVAIGIYLALGLALLISRVAMPSRREARVEQPASGEEVQEMALAA